MLSGIAPLESIKKPRFTGAVFLFQEGVLGLFGMSDQFVHKLGGYALQAD